MIKWNALVAILMFGMSLTAYSQESDSTQVVEAKPIQGTDTIVDFAKSFLGVPYCYGGGTPTGFDCSGFVNYVFSNFGIDMPRTTSEIATIGSEIPVDSCRKGDIILFSGRNKDKRPIGHAGIVISDFDEPLKFIHSATSNKRGIVITALDAFDYYKSRFVKVIRVLEDVNIFEED